MKIKTQNKDAKNIVFISMKKIVFLMLLIALVACNVSAANLYNYVYNGTSWVPMISTDDGQQKLWIEMKNCSYGSVQNNLYVNGNIGIGTTSPGQKLEVVGTGNFTTGLYVAEQQVCREDGTNCPAGANESGNITAVTGASPITSTEGATPQIGIDNASTSQIGAVQLTDSTSTTSSILAATATAVKSAYDLADSKLSSEADTLATVTGRGNTTTQNITIGDKITFALGEFIDNLVDGWLRVTGSLNITGGINAAGNITPSSNNTYSLGSSSLVWKDVYVGSNSLYLGGIVLSNDAGTLKWDGGLNVTGTIDSPDMDRVETNYVLTAFRASEAGSLSVQYVQDGIIDEFEDQTGIDADASQSENYDSGGDYYYGGSSGNFLTTNESTAYNWSAGSFSDINVTGNENITLNRFNATGGTITYSDSNGENPRSSPAYAGGYTIHTFTSNGTFTVTSGGNVEYLVIAGGGGGGTGGGGAGGLLYNSSFAVNPQAYTVTIGSGGASGDANYAGGNGTNSVFSTLTAIGGGGGGRNDRTYGNAGGAQLGGSGGGAGASSSSGNDQGAPGTAGQGNAGGNVVITSPNPAAGGGGAGAVGGNSSGSTCGSGGSGLAYSISGTSTYYAGGGGGSYPGNSNGTGGTGGGGAGQVAGTANTGGGGGGYATGGSGIVIIRYLTDSYNTPGNYTSQVFDAGSAASWDNINWGSVTVNNASLISNISIETRTSDDAASWSSWSSPHTNPSGTINSSARYLQYMANLTTNSSYSPILEWVNISYSITENLTLVSTSTEATSEPTKSKVVILMENVSADVTVNTDIKAYVSLDNGANYEQVTLTDKGKYNSGGTIRILTGSETLTDRDDQTMRWNITTFNDKSIKIHGVAHSWK